MKWSGRFSRPPDWSRGSISTWRSLPSGSTLETAVRAAKHPEGGRRSHRDLFPGPPVLAGSSTLSSEPKAPGKRKRQSCWRTRIDTSTSHWSTRWRDCHDSTSTCGTSSASADQTIRIPIISMDPASVDGLPIDPNYLATTCEQARLPVPLRRARPGNQHLHAGVRGPPGTESAQHGKHRRARSLGAVTRGNLQGEHRRRRGSPAAPLASARSPLAPRCLPRPARQELDRRRARLDFGVGTSTVR